MRAAGWLAVLMLLSVPAFSAEPAALPPDLGTRKSGSDWPGFLGPTGDSVSTETGILSPWPKEGLRVVWHKRLGIGYGMPSISRGRLFLFDRHGDKARLTCLKSETGDELWRFEYPTDYEDHYGYNNGPRCCPVIDGDRVYLFGVEGMIHCVRIDDGKPLWKVDTAAEFGVVQNFFGVASTPVIEEDVLIVHVGGSPPNSGNSPTPEQKGNGSGIVALDKRTGKVRYKITDELASCAGPVLTTINGRRWCFVFARGGLIGFEPRTGKLDFHYPWRAKLLESVNASNPVVVRDLVLISECYGPGSSLLRVKSGGYEVVWTDADKGRNKSLQCHWNTPIYHDGHVYACSGRHSPTAELRSVELITGKVKWTAPGLGQCSLLKVDGRLICLTEDGGLGLFKINPEKPELVSVMELPRKAKDNAGPVLEYPCWAAPILSHGLLYVRGKDQLICLELIPTKKP